MGDKREVWRQLGAGEGRKEGGTFTGRRAAVVFQVGAVLALIVLRALAEIVTGAIVALSPVLAGVGLTVIYVQLRVSEAEQKVSRTRTLGTHRPIHWL